MEVSVHQGVMNLIAEGKVKTDLDDTLVIGLDQSNVIVYVNARAAKEGDLLGKHITDISSLTHNDLLVPNKSVKNKFLKAFDVTWFFTEVDGTKILVQDAKS